MNHVWRNETSCDSWMQADRRHCENPEERCWGPSTGSRGTVEARSVRTWRWESLELVTWRPVVPFTGMGKVGCLCGDVLQAPVGEGSPAARDAVTPAKPSWSSENGAL